MVTPDGLVVGQISSFVTVKEGAARWLELTGEVDGGPHGSTAFTARIPIAEGWTLVRLHGH
jgi:hypothetical protein